MSDRSLFLNNGTLSLVFEMAVQAAEMHRSDAAAEMVNIPTTDAGLELILDIMERQIRVALSDPTNTWADLFDRLSTHRHSVRSLRAAEGATTRFAARQLTFEITPLADPAPCGTPSGIWAELIAALEASDGTMLQQHAHTFRTVLSSNVPEEDWQAIALRYGIGAGGADTFGLTDYVLEDDAEDDAEADGDDA